MNNIITLKLKQDKYLSIENLGTSHNVSSRDLKHETRGANFHQDAYGNMNTWNAQCKSEKANILWFRN